MMTIEVGRDKGGTYYAVGRRLTKNQGGWWVTWKNDPGEEAVIRDRDWTGVPIEPGEKKRFKLVEETE